jgi:hypothetical protein
MKSNNQITEISAAPSFGEEPLLRSAKVADGVGFEPTDLQVNQKLSHVIGKYIATNYLARSWFLCNSLFTYGEYS